jgi:hypothetical protein
VIAARRLRRPVLAAAALLGARGQRADGEGQGEDGQGEAAKLRHGEDPEAEAQMEHIIARWTGILERGG